MGVATGCGCKEVLYSGKFSHGANFCIFRMKASVCENKKMRNLCECINTYVRKYTWPKLRGMAMCVCVRACEKEKKRNFILKPFHVFCENLHHRKFPAIQYIDFLILLIPTPLVSVLFYSSIPTFCSLNLGTHAPEGYGSCPVCVSVWLSATLIWGLGLVEI